MYPVYTLKPLAAISVQADNWDRGSLLGFRSFSFPEVPPYEDIAQPVIVIQGADDTSVRTPSVRKVSLCRNTGN